MRTTVDTLSGRTCGELEDGVRRFLGVRYAYADRFCLPQTVNAWRGELDCTQFSDCCPQYREFHDESLKKNTLWYDEFRRGLKFSYSEDCLRLNVYAPEKGERLPVILYVHGGSFIKGSSDERAFDGTAYAKRGVIVVTINYRLNIFGFYADKSVCNLALYDMLCALNFVKRNISAFGGDPNNITVMGQSAGAMSLTALLQNREFVKNVKGAVLLSGGGILKGLYAPHSRKRAERFSYAIKNELLKTDMDIKTASYKDVFRAYEKVSAAHPIAALLSCMPVFDGTLIRKVDYKKFGNKKEIPCIISVTKDDLQPKKYLLSSAKRYSGKCSAPVWLLRFDRNLPGDDRGAWHSSDLWYVFGTLNKHPYRKFEAVDQDISDELINRICAFATKQNPNTDKYPEWRPKTELALE